VFEKRAKVTESATDGRKAFMKQGYAIHRSISKKLQSGNGTGFCALEESKSLILRIAGRNFRRAMGRSVPAATRRVLVRYAFRQQTTPCPNAPLKTELV
jgi:hypothetical protein